MAGYWVICFWICVKKVSMGRIKKYFSGWHAMRIVRLVMAVALGFAFFENYEYFYLFGTVVFFVQAVFDLGCSGGSCGVKVPKTDQPVVKIKKYESLK
jgi:hypothetical protein